MKYFVILDLTDGGDDTSAHEFDSAEEAFEFYDDFDCPRWVAVEVLRPTTLAVDTPCVKCGGRKAHKVNCEDEIAFA